MKLEKVLHMVGGASEFSYAANSKVQEKAILRIRPMLEEAVGEVHKNLLHNKMVVADLGCSSGPNTFLVMSEVMKIVGERCQKLDLMQPPEMQLFLNDLPGNDFNNIFRSLDSFEDRVRANKGPVSIPHYVMGLPGSFYGRLFPSQSVHLFHSANSLHRLSQVPEGIVENKNENVPLNKGNINIGRTSPPLVAKLFQEQFIKDFSQFLKMRSNELVPGGQMVVTFLGRKNEDIYHGELISFWGLMSETLNSMVIEGLVEKDKFDSFHMPVYTPSMQEVKAIINAEELLDIVNIQIYESYWHSDLSEGDAVVDNIQSGKNIAMFIRACFEPSITSHFGASILDELFSRFAINTASHLANEKLKHAFLIISLKKKEHM